MSDVVIMGVSLGGVTIVLSLFIWLRQERDGAERHRELRTFQLENARLIQQMEKNLDRRQIENEKFFLEMEKTFAHNQEENRRFFRGLSHNVGQIYLKLDEEGGEKK